MTPQERAKQQAEVMLAYANGTEIESKHADFNSWHKSNSPCWNWEMFTFRVKKPAPKVVKLEAWIDERGVLTHLAPKSYAGTGWKRIPSLDLEYVEDES